MEKVAAIYARVSSNQQKEQQTIQSQTAALVEYAKTHGYMIPSAWQFQDDGYSGATLVRPGLEAIRDLAATGQITAVLVYSPDRLSRKYAYQVVLAEEFARAGVELVFLQAPSAATAEDQLLLQFQGMIAEYERAQIAERSRRGKRHRALQGCVNVLSAAGYGYRYVKKTDVSTAYYQVVNTEAEVVRMMFDGYTRQGFSIEAITRELNQRRIPTRSGRPWLRSTVWGMLRNPAYCGRACFGKSQARKPQHINRRTRQRGGLVSRHGSGQERPRQEWIRNSCSRVDHGGDLCSRSRAIAKEQTVRQSTNSPSHSLARLAGVSAVWLRSVQCERRRGTISPILLSLYRFAELP